MSDDLHIIVAGAGIGGLAVAALLGRAGHRVSVLEKAPAFSPVGAGIQLSPNAMHVCDGLGIRSALLKTGFLPRNAVIREGRSGKPLFSSALNPEAEKRYGQPYLHIHRADLHAALLSAANDAGVNILLNTELLSVSQEVNGSVCAETRSGPIVGDILIGADGVRSVVKKAVTDKDASAQFSGQLAWRATVPTDALPEHCVPQDATVWVGPGRHFVAYYVSGGHSVNMVAVEERADLTAESWSLAGRADVLQQAFSGWDTPVTAITEAVDAPMVWGLYDRKPLKRWVRGRIALMGDAAHPMLPFMAQGAAAALEDAWVLAHMLANADSAPEDCLKAYETARIKRASYIQGLSRQNSTLFHAHTVPERLWRGIKFTGARLFPPAAQARLDKVYGTNVTREHLLNTDT